MTNTENTNTCPATCAANGRRCAAPDQHDGLHDFIGVPHPEISAHNVETGDVLHFFRSASVVKSTDTVNGFGWPIAETVDGWGVTMTGPVSTVPVVGMWVEKVAR